RLPGGIFNRGFVRTVGRFLGLDEENLVAEYDLAVRQMEPTSPEPPQQQATSRRAPRVALRMTLWIAAAGVLASSAWAGWSWYVARQAELNAAASAAPPTPTPPNIPPMVLTPPEPSTPPQASSQSESPWAAPPLGPPDGSPAPSGPTGQRALRLKISADKETSLTVTTDSQQAFSGRMLAGENHTFAAENSLTIEAQDAGAIRLELNGQTLAPIGPPGQTGKITLDRRHAGLDAGGPH
ncbi:MAG TPA: RodZ domain-containing protein, partial [Terriglobia bacterium]